MHNGPVRFIYRGNPAIGQQYRRVSRKLIDYWNRFSSAPRYRKKLLDGTRIEIRRSTSSLYTVIVNTLPVLAEEVLLSGIILYPSSQDSISYWGDPFTEGNSPLGTANTSDITSIYSIFEYDTENIEWDLNRFPQYEEHYPNGISYGENYWISSDGEIVFSLDNERYKPTSTSDSYYYKGVGYSLAGICGIAVQNRPNEVLRLIACTIPSPVDPKFTLQYVDVSSQEDILDILPGDWQHLATSSDFEEDEEIQSTWVFDRSGTKLTAVVNKVESGETTQSTVYEATISGASIGIAVSDQVINTSANSDRSDSWSFRNISRTIDTSSEAEWELYSGPTVYEWACNFPDGWGNAITTFIWDCGRPPSFWYYEDPPEGALCMRVTTGSPGPCGSGPDVVLDVEWSSNQPLEWERSTIWRKYYYSNTITHIDPISLGVTFDYHCFLYSDYSHTGGVLSWLKLNEDGDREWTTTVVQTQGYEQKTYTEYYRWNEFEERYRWAPPVGTDGWSGVTWFPLGIVEETEDKSLTSTIELEFSTGETTNYISSWSEDESIINNIRVQFADLRNNVLIVGYEKKITTGSDGMGPGTRYPIGDIFINGVLQSIPATPTSAVGWGSIIWDYGTYYPSNTFEGSHAINNENKYIFAAPYGTDPNTSLDLWFHSMSDSNLVAEHGMTVPHPTFQKISMI